MTWQVASYALLGLALAAGFGWYERTHPSSKLLALVATLAALAVLGRVAFWAIPGVKPTTDIVLLSGYVLGGAPGFAVGAVAAIASNVFFGQGPFTPWQMVGWGAVGIFGAVLARTIGRDLGRWPLAIACGVAGLLYGTWMDFHMWLMYTDHRFAQWAIISGQGLPFNVAHAVGNVIFCVAFGPALVRALGRFRDRFEVTWHPAPAATTACLALLAVLVYAPPSSAADRTVTKAIRYLEASQTANGGFASIKDGKQANEMQTGWVIMGLAAAGRHPSDVRRGKRSASQYIADRARKVSYAGDVSRTILAMRAAGQPVGALVRKLENAQRDSGAVIGLVNQTAFAILSLRAAGKPTSTEMIRSGADYIVEQQNPDGGWNFGGKGAPSGVDDTSAVIQALVAAGRKDDAAVRKAVSWLRSKQAGDGGFSLGQSTGSNAQSTGWAVQALAAAGLDPAKIRRDGSRTAIQFLRSLQNADGSIRYSRTSRQTPVWVTGQVLAALAGKPMPVKAPKRAKQKRKAGAAAASAPARGSVTAGEARSAGAITALLLAPIVA